MSRQIKDTATLTAMDKSGASTPVAKGASKDALPPWLAKKGAAKGAKGAKAAKGGKGAFGGKKAAPFGK